MSKNGVNERASESDKYAWSLLKKLPIMPVNMIYRWQEDKHPRNIQTVHLKNKLWGTEKQSARKNFETTEKRNDLRLPWSGHPSMTSDEIVTEVKGNLHNA